MADSVDVTGDAVPKQCQPSSGTCACTTASAGQQQPCEVKNSFGTCLGTTTCNPLQGGFQTCTARTPVAELCNGTDDDCDGLTDEALDDLRCGAGACERVVASCINGRTQTCTAGMPTTEVCNQLDDNCNGQVDENFNTQADVANCGACGRVCTLTNAVPKCETGACAIDRCIAGWVNLDGVAANGCEHPCTPSNNGVEICDGADNDCDGTVDEGFNLLTDPTNCGRCGLTCNLSTGNVSTYACIAGACAVGTCVMGRGDCNQQYADGCETNLVNSLTHCGQCGLACAPANASGLCQMGSCRVQTCNPGFRDCNMLPVDGCEVNSNDDVTNCGVCGNTCMAANATSTCQTGTCRFTCLANWFDADNNAANGCEYACIRTNNGLEACDGIDNDCDGAIDEDFNKQTDVNHCGVCNRQCVAPSATTLCSSGSCGIASCIAGRANCNNQYLDGCEVDIDSNPLNCGSCGNACNAPNVATYQCVATQCRVGTCTANRANCNNTFSDGCEVDIGNSVANCGGCGITCTVPFATPACAAGMCGIGACNVDRTNCNTMVADGCEVNLANDVNNCGACGNRCTAANASSSCSNRACGFACNANFYNLDGQASNGCEYACMATGSDLPYVDSAAHRAHDDGGAVQRLSRECVRLGRFGSPVA